MFNLLNVSQGTCALINKTLVNCTGTKENTWSAFLFLSWGSLRHSPGSECLKLHSIQKYAVHLYALYLLKQVSQKLL